MQVLVFGSNGQGFHGAGSAGLAMRGTASNTWRDDPQFLRAMRAPEGHPDRIGDRAVFGVARGFQTGRNGSSYAIQTVTRPGARRSISIQEIETQIDTLLAWASSHPTYEVLVTPIGCGYAGYTREEMDRVWARKILPSNVTRIYPTQD